MFGVEYLKAILYIEFYLHTERCLILCAELEVSKKQSEADKKKVEELTRERDLLSKVKSADTFLLSFNNNNNNNNNNLICIAPVCAKRLQWRWRTGLSTAIKCLTENICL